MTGRIEKVDGAHERDTRHVKREKCDGSMGGALCVSVRTVVFGARYEISAKGHGVRYDRFRLDSAVLQPRSEMQELQGLPCAGVPLPPSASPSSFCRPLMRPLLLCPSPAAPLSPPPASPPSSHLPACPPYQTHISTFSSLEIRTTYPPPMTAGRRIIPVLLVSRCVTWGDAGAGPGL